MKTTTTKYGSLTLQMNGQNEDINYHDDDDDDKFHDTNMSLCSDHDDEGYDSSDDDDDSVSVDDNDNELLLKSQLLSKVSSFTLKYDSDKAYRATELKILDFSRPHMRTFHGSWICFLLSWFVWFSMTPLLPYIQQSLEEDDENGSCVTMDDIWISNMYSMVGTVFLRLILGPLCDRYGAKHLLTSLVISCAIPLALSGILIHGKYSLLLVRFWIGCIGGTLVPAQYWITSHFTRDICGMNMAIVAGWGALGGGLAQLIMGTILYPILLNTTLLDGNVNITWRIAVIFPASIAIIVALFFNYYSDDCPLGSYKQVQRAGLMQERSAIDSFRSGVFNFNAWILFIQ